MSLDEIAASGHRAWRPKRVLVTPAALEHAHGRAMVERSERLAIPVTFLAANRLPAPDAENSRAAYREAKATLAIVVAPDSKRRLQPIPPSADWRIDLAEGCPAHCQYCYLAGSLRGPPVTRAYANLDDILAVLPEYLGRGRVTSRQTARAEEGTTFEASCYTDPLGIEHLTGSLSAAIARFGQWEAVAQLRFTTKFDVVEPLLGIAHRGRTRARFSVNAKPLIRYEGGTPSLAARLVALRRMAEASYPVGLTIAPIMAVEGWREAYGDLIEQAAATLDGLSGLDLTVELITHRFTPGSKEVLNGWYPGSDLEMDEAARARKRTKFGSLKYVYTPTIMAEMKTTLLAAIARELPQARVLYWT